MGMDALAAAALDSLVKDVLPRLTAGLGAVAKRPGPARTADAAVAALLGEAQELLGLLGAWAAGAAPAADALEDELSVDDAMALLAAEDVADMPDVHISGTGRSVADSLSDAGDDEVTDDEAAALLAGMGGDTPARRDAGDDEVTDDEAAALLAGMGGDTPAAAGPEADDDGLDAETRQMLALVEAGPVSAGGGPDDQPQPARAVARAAAPAAAEISDDDALRMLAEMDAPPPAAAEISDDDALRMLAEMDAPAGKAAGGPSAAPHPSADDEALAMLRSLGGGLEDDGDAAMPAAAHAAPVPARAAARADAGDAGDAEELTEIDEFAKNEFASDPDMMNDFSTNTDELMETLDATILQLEQNPRDRETIESIFRAAHTLKGAAGMFGFKAMERVMHRMEGLFDQVRKGALVPDSNTIDVVFQGLDVLRTLLGAAKDGKPSGVKTVPVVRALSLAAVGQYTKAPSGRPPTAAAEAPAAAEPSDGGGGDKAGGGRRKTVEQSTIRVDLERLDALVNLVGELVIDRTRFATIEEDIRTTTPQLKVSGNMTETVQLFGRHMNEIHDIIMKIRMVPIGNAFNKFSRLVRDIARQLGKDMELYIDGEDTELDKTLVEQIGDPLIHLIRNSCDHGIEMPDVRAAAGKKRTGQIWLSARQEGNNIIITIQDDGKGLPVDIIRKKAIERGLIAEEAVLSKRDIFNLIFEPGFSTAEKVTNLSGRGVGMDVVRKQISKLKGLIDMDSEPGKGTTTTIRLPLTLAIVQSLLVESAGECLAIPLSTVIESVRIKPEEIQTVGDAEVIKRHGKVLPLVHLHDVLDLGQKADVAWYSGRRSDEASHLTALRIARRTERLYVVIVGSGDRRFGIVVDQLLNQQEMVIKSLGPVMKQTPCVAGGAVLGNGEVVLVLDIQELEDRFRSKTRSKAA